MYNRYVQIWFLSLFFNSKIFLKKGSILIAGRRSYTDKFKTSLYNELFKNINQDELEDFNLAAELNSFSLDYQEPVFYFYDINAKLSYSFTDENNISFSYYSSLDKLERSQESFFYSQEKCNLLIW